ncbi:MAG: glycosyltransferase [Pseudomonadota bacterium]
MTGQAATVSVAVISYNAATTIKETLDSILAQDLGPARIELAISDDASHDETVDVVERWLARHGDAFANVVFLRNAENGGVSRNCNLVWRASSAQWIKTIAADDILQPHCLSANLEFADQHPDCSVIVSKMRWFGSIDRVTPEPSQLAFFQRSALEQYQALRFGSFNFAPTSFIRKKAFEDIGYADEQFRNIEDLPLWLRFTRAGYALCFYDRETVNYRVSDSISKSSTRFVNVPFLRDLIEIHKQQTPIEADGLRYRYLRFERGIGLYSTLVISKLSGNRRSALTRVLEGLALLLRPRDLWGALRRRVGRLTGKASGTPG